MKKLFATALLASGLMISIQAVAQKKDEDKSKRPSPPAKVTSKLSSGANVTIDYGQPSVKGRTIGKDLEPMDGKVWRTGANEATVFETDKDIMVMNQKLPAGKYGLFTIFNGSDVTVIFSKTWNQWGAFTYKDADDVLRIKTKATEITSPSEKLVFAINPNDVSFVWGTRKVDIPVK